MKKKRLQNMFLLLGCRTATVITIYPSIIYLLSIKVMEKLGPIAADFGQEVGYTQGRSSIYHRGSTEMNNNPHSYSQLLAIWSSQLA